MKTSITDIQYNLFNAMNGEGEEKQSLKDRMNPMPPTTGEGFRLVKTAILEAGEIDARLARCVYALGLPVRQLTCR